MGNLAIRLPQALVTQRNLRPGDAVQIVAATPSRLELARDTRREDAIARMADRNWPSTGAPFDREEAIGR